MKFKIQNRSCEIPSILKMVCISLFLYYYYYKICDVLKIKNLKRNLKN